MENIFINSLVLQSLIDELTPNYILENLYLIPELEYIDTTKFNLIYQKKYDDINFSDMLIIIPILHKYNIKPYYGELIYELKKILKNNIGTNNIDKQCMYACFCDDILNDILYGCDDKKNSETFGILCYLMDIPTVLWINDFWSGVKVLQWGLDNEYGGEINYDMLYDNEFCNAKLINLLENTSLWNKIKPSVFEMSMKYNKLEILELIDINNNICNIDNNNYYYNNNNNNDKYRNVEYQSTYGIGGHNAALNGHFDLLKYVIENGYKNVYKICSGAAKGGHLEIFEWAIEKNYFFNLKLIFEEAMPYGHFEIIKSLCNFFSTINIRPNTIVGNIAAKKGYFDILKYMYETRMITPTCTDFSGAAEGGHMNILEYLLSINCPIDSYACAMAASSGHFDILKWLRKNNCPWDDNVCAYAAENGHLDIIKWARKNNCFWSASTTYYAYTYFNYEILKYAIINGCPIYEGIFRSTRPEVIMLLKEIKKI